tara:strand:- start:2341 stop:2895 length:555 start_codon:yes stop_codon:yes gene_type:complete
MADIPPNHVSRYEWAARELVKRLEPGSLVLDAACGCGYGSFILANVGFRVECFDLSAEAELYQQNFHHERVKFRRDSVLNIWGDYRTYDAVVSIETIEHVDEKWIKDIGRMTDVMIGTVPNQDVVPFDAENYPWHLKHYTKAEVIELMEGWWCSDWATQYAKWEDYEMVPGDDGMTLGWVGHKS